MAYSGIETDGHSFNHKSAVAVGATTYSYYEYLLKQWIQTGHTKGDE